MIRLSPYQRTFYVEWKLNPERYDYNIVIDQEMEGTIDAHHLNLSISRFIQDHVLFNSHVIEKNDVLYWTKNSQLFPLDHFANSLSNQELLNYVQNAFDIESGPLYRFGLIKEGSNKFRFIMVLHHLLVDGLSLDTVYETLANYYNNLDYTHSITNDEQIKLISQLSEKHNTEIIKLKTYYQNFWHSKLFEIDRLDLGFLKLSIGNITFNQINDGNIQDLNPIGEIKFRFDSNVFSKVSQLKRKYVITPYLYSQSIYALLLYRYTTQAKFGISYPIAIKEGIDLIYGAHINVNIMPFDFSSITRFEELINQVKSFMKGIKLGEINYGYCPIEQIVTASNTNGLKLSFVVGNLKENKLKFNGCNITRLPHELNIDQVEDLSILFAIKDGELCFSAKYKKQVINSVLLEQFITTYKRLYLLILDKLLDENCDPQELAIKSIQLLDEIQYKKIVYDWNQTEKNYPRNKTIQQLFEEQVARTPNNIALVYEDIKLTYKELNQRANQLAHYLLECCCEKTKLSKQSHNHKKIATPLSSCYDLSDELIALCLDRSEYMLIAILATLKAGAAYVPMDPSYPDERISYILDDTKAKVILTNVIYQAKIQEIMNKNHLHVTHTFVAESTITPKVAVVPLEAGIPAAKIIAIESKELEARLAKQTNPKTQTTSTNLAYVIYTSGTTGKPKGVMIEHTGIVNRITWMNNTYPLNPDDKILQKTPWDCCNLNSAHKFV